MKLPAIHIISPFHGQALRPNWDHCAFSSKAEKMPEVIEPFGYKTILYSNGQTSGKCSEHVMMLSEKEFDFFYPKQKPGEFHGNHAVIGERGYPLFDHRLRQALGSRSKQGDIVCHVFGRSHAGLIQSFPHLIHVESGVGSSDKPFGAHRIYESEEWKNYQLGRDEHDSSLAGNQGLNRLYQFVVPNYFRTEDWSLGDGAGDYVLYFGRITHDKGMCTIAEIIRQTAKERIKRKFVFAGQGDFEGTVMKEVLRDPKPNPDFLDIDYVGPVIGSKRSQLIGNARVMLCPTTFFEPFCGSAVESQFCGTPVLSVNYGAFSSTIEHGKTGWRCQTLGDWMEGIKYARTLGREYIRQRAISKYSFEVCGALYDQAFRQLSDLFREGWYTRESYRVP